MTPETVDKAVRRLIRNGLATSLPYRSIVPTGKGEDTARPRASSAGARLPGGDRGPILGRPTRTPRASSTTSAT